MVYTLVIPAMVGSIKQEEYSPGWPGKKARQQKWLEAWLKWQSTARASQVCKVQYNQNFKHG
jgi:hypothetical protein